MPGKIPRENKVYITGRLTYDPTVRFSRTRSTSVCDFDIAAERSYKDRLTQEWKKEVTYVPVAVWGKLAEVCGHKLKKGSAVFIEGRLRSRIWVDEKSRQHRILEVLCYQIAFLDEILEPQTTDEAAEPEATVLGEESPTIEQTKGGNDE